MSTEYSIEYLLDDLTEANGLCIWIFIVVGIVGIIVSTISMIMLRKSKTNSNLFPGLCIATHAAIFVLFLLTYSMIKWDNYRDQIPKCHFNKCNHSITMMVHMFLIVMIIMMASFTAGRMRKPTGAVDWVMDITLILQIIALWVYSFFFMGFSLALSNPTKFLNSVLKITTQASTA